MLVLLLLLYGLPVYLIFFKYKLIPLTGFWKVFLWIPPLAAGVFVWFAFGRFTPTIQTAYVQAPVVQVAAEVNGPVTELLVQTNAEVKQGTPLFQVDRRPYQHRYDQAFARLTEVRETSLGLLANVYAAEASLNQADANLLVARQNIEVSIKDLDTALEMTGQVTRQLQLAENSATRTAPLVASGASSREEYESLLRDVANQRAILIDSQNKVSRAEVAKEIAQLQLNVAESAKQVALAEWSKAEAMVNPVKTLKRVVDNRRANLDQLQRSQAESTPSEQQASQIQTLTEELNRLNSYLQAASDIDPFKQEFSPITRQAVESLNQAKLDLERTEVTSPVDGIVSSFHLTVGTHAQAGSAVASIIDTTQWRLIVPVPENWLEKIRPGDEVTFSLRNYPGRLRKATVEFVGRGVLQGQGVPSGNLPDTDPRQTRQPDTPQAGQEFQVHVLLKDDNPSQPLRVGLTGRATIFASGGFPIVNQLASILHYLLSALDFFHPKPSATMVLIIAAVIGGGWYFYRSKTQRKH